MDDVTLADDAGSSWRLVQVALPEGLHRFSLEAVMKDANSEVWFDALGGYSGTVAVPALGLAGQAAIAVLLGLLFFTARMTGATSWIRPTAVGAAVLLAAAGAPSVAHAAGFEATLPAPATLEQAVEWALSHSAAIEVAGAELAATRAEATIRRSALLPKVNAEATYLRLEDGGRATDLGPLPVDLALPGSVTLAHLSVEQPLYTGQIRPAIRAAEAATRAQRARLLATQREVAHQTRRAYVAARYASEQVELARELLALADDALGRGRALAVRAVVGEIEVLELSERRARAAEALAAALGARAESLAALAALVGRPVAPIGALPVVTAGDFATEPSSSEARRAAAQAMVQVARERQDATRGAVLAPQVALRADYLYTDMGGGPFDDLVGGEMASVGVAVRLPLFDFGRRRGELAVARAELARAKSRAQEVEEQLSAERLRARAQVLAAEQVLAAAEQTVANSEAHLRLVRADRALGDASYWQEVSARQQELERRAGLLEAHRRLDEAWLALDHTREAGIEAAR